MKNLNTDDPRVKQFIEEVKSEAEEKIVSWFTPKRLERFDHVTCDIVGDEIASVSFVSRYNTWTRVGQQHYSLKRFRKERPSPFLRVGGFLDHHIKEHGDCFFTIHTFNKRMRTQSRMMHERLINSHGKELTANRDKLIFLGEETFHNVQQDFFVFPQSDFNEDVFWLNVLQN